MSGVLIFILMALVFISGTTFFVSGAIIFMSGERICNAGFFFGCPDRLYSFIIHTEYFPNMSGQFSIADADKKLSDISFEHFIKNQVKERRLSLRKLSGMMNEHYNFMNQQFARKTLTPSLLYALSMHLKVNVFELFSNQLPENLRTTARETALTDEIAALQKQLADMTKERDIYKEVAMGR